MPAVYLVRHDDDATFEADSLLAPLASLGFDRVLTDQPSAIEHTAVVLIIVSAAAAQSADFAGQAAAALHSRTPVVVVQRGPVGGEGAVLEELRAAATIPPVVAADPEELWRRLARLLKADATPAGQLDGAGVALRWHETAFSVLLADAARRNDFVFGSELIGAFVAHVAVRGEPYPAGAAKDDLGALRAMRQFVLMRRYAAAAVEGGATDPTVHRQYGQALIELKLFDEAVAVLQPVTEMTPPTHREHYEARGLIGRAYKQRYVDTGELADGRWLTRAIETYWKAYNEEHDNTWHGINVVSCIRRAVRDGVEVPPTDPPDVIAREILETLRGREAGGKPLEVWDAATRVEAYIDLGDMEQAQSSLQTYLTHPAMTPFEVTSTYRQFDEVLRLGKRAGDGPLLERIVECVVRLRAGGRIATADVENKRFLLRVADPEWLPTNVPDLELGTRLGSVLTIGGTERTIRELLKDPLVISIEESRPAGPPDSESFGSEPLDFVGVAKAYSDQDVSFAEKGRRALVAVVDNGIDVLHRAFRNADGTSCIAAVWDQTDPDHAPESTVPIGRLHTAEDIAGYVRDGTVPDHLGRGNPHGTHVASIAVGRAYEGFRGGVAPEARLLVVIPDSTDPIGYSASYRAALDFIDVTASELDVPVVVNISQGMNAGAHDGLSALEADFDVFCRSGRARGRVVVKSAGNERDKRGHAKLTVPPGGVDELVWRCPPGNTCKVRLELWWDAANAYRFQLRAPSGDSSEWVHRGKQVVDDFFPGQGDYTIELVPSHVDNGASQLRIEFTRRFARQCTPDAEWALTVEADKVEAPGDVHAWIERHDGRRTSFDTHHSEEMTLSVPGTARSVITVGAVAAALPIRLGAFSSFGPTRDGAEDRPDLCAPGVQITGAKSGSGDGVVALDGTSAAAPHVSGAVALVLSRAIEANALPPTSSQVRGILRRSTKFGNKYWDRGQGYGVLDVGKLLGVGLSTLL